MRFARGRRECGPLFPPCARPGEWTVQRGHELLERVVARFITQPAVPGATVFTHLEPINDPAAWQDLTLDRRDAVVRSKGY